MTNPKEKINQLFYSYKKEHRTLAFELAKGQGCYEEMVRAWYAEWMVYPYFQEMQPSWDQSLGEIQADCEDGTFEMPVGLALTQFYLEELCYDFFQEKVDMSGQQLTPLQEFPLPLLNCTFIKELNLSWNNLKTLPEEFGQLYQLKKLNLGFNHDLRDLPKSMALLTQLEEIDFYGIQGVFAQETEQEGEYTHQFPDFFRSWTSIKQIQLGDVLLDGLPTWINEWRRLEAFHIYSGWGSYPTLELPENLCKCYQLKSLRINSYTTSIPDHIHHLTQLEHLSVQPALHIPSNIQYLKNLKTLDLSYFASDYLLELEGYTTKWDLYDKGVPEGISRLEIYGWKWLLNMPWLEQFTYVDIEPYAFTELEKEELEAALPNCTFVFKQQC